MSTMANYIEQIPGHMMVKTLGHLKVAMFNETLVGVEEPISHNVTLIFSMSEVKIVVVSLLLRASHAPQLRGALLALPYECCEMESHHFFHYTIASFFCTGCVKLPSLQFAHEVPVPRI